MFRKYTSLLHKFLFIEMAIGQLCELVTEMHDLCVFEVGYSLRTEKVVAQ